MIHGPDLSKVQDAAKAAVMRHFVDLVDADDVPPTQRAMYVLKALIARDVLKGGQSDYIDAEAAARGITSQAMAQMIDGLAKESEAVELARMKANIAIDGAADESAIHTVLEGLGVSVSVAA